MADEPQAEDQSFDDPFETIGGFDSEGIWKGPTRNVWSDGIEVIYGFKTKASLKFFDEEWAVYDADNDDEGLLRSYLANKMFFYKQHGEILIIKDKDSL